MATALCAALRRRGVRVAPFKAQNMSNNSFVTLDGGEIGRAQASQAEACGLEPCVEMNPILLKPSGGLGSQLVILGKAQGHLKARDYYEQVPALWETVRGTLDGWRSKCDVLVTEGAGSPVELNLIHRDLVNLRPCEYLDGRWLLVADIERGGVFAQIVGTWQLMPEAARARGLGVIVNQFRGDLSLFDDARRCLAEHIPLTYLGVVPFTKHLQPESEDSLCEGAEQSFEGGRGNAKLAWIRFPHLSNSQDVQPWRLDTGIRVEWARTAAELTDAQIIILPGSKNTLADLAWLRETGLAEAVIAAVKHGVPVVGICGGYQMLGLTLTDAEGIAGERGAVPGLGLLPVDTFFFKEKTVRQVEANWDGADAWKAYEIHMGQTTMRADRIPTSTPPLFEKHNVLRAGNVWGTYLHGLFESPAVRAELAAHLPDYTAFPFSWRAEMAKIYDGMADLLEAHVDLTPVWHYVDR